MLTDRVVLWLMCFVVVVFGMKQSTKKSVPNNYAGSRCLLCANHTKVEAQRFNVVLSYNYVRFTQDDDMTWLWMVGWLMVFGY